MRAHVYLSGEMRKQSKKNKIETLKYFKELLDFEECDTNGKSTTLYKNMNKKKEKLDELFDLDFFNKDFFINDNNNSQLKSKIMFLIFDKNTDKILEVINNSYIKVDKDKNTLINIINKIK